MTSKSVLYTLVCTTMLSTAAAVYLLWEREVAINGSGATGNGQPPESTSVRAPEQVPFVQENPRPADESAESGPTSEELERQVREAFQPRATGEVPPSDLASAMSNPALRDVIRTRQAATVEMLYKDFFTDSLARRQLSAAQIEQLKTLLVEHQMQIADEVADIGHNTVLDSLAAAGDPASLDTQIEELIGNSQYRAFQSYRETLPERLQVSTLSMDLIVAGVPFTDRQSAALLDIMLDEKARLPQPQRSAELNERDFVLQGLAWADELAENVAERAGQALTSDQLRVFRRFQQQQFALRASSRQILESQESSP